ncbi:MAG: glycosyltransferase [Candidatus Omnitrophica bacterium]|nr:glycosyltransferase [Candidatus Omnitrophota bacterium]
MKNALPKIQKKLYIKGICVFILLAFTFTSIVPPSYAQTLNLPAPGTKVNLSPTYIPPLLKGVKIHPDNPFHLEFILDKGDLNNGAEQLKMESTRLIKYFLASLTVPEKDLWVNLSPHEKNRIIPDAFGVTEMGRDLLAQDYILKQITASLMYPEGKIGKEFWNKIYAEAKNRFGTTDIPVDTFNKVWIVPEKAVVYENKDSAYVVEAKLKVMLEEEYEALEQTKDHRQKTIDQPSAEKRSMVSGLSSMVIRQIIIPAIEKEVNTGKNFAQLRQVYHSLILAVWFKDKVKESLLGKAYVDQNKIDGVDIPDKAAKDKIWAQYVETFKKGAYNYIKEDYDPVTQQIVPKKYFSGGAGLNQIRKVYRKTTDLATLPEGISDRAMVVESNFSPVNPIRPVKENSKIGPTFPMSWSKESENYIFLDADNFLWKGWDLVDNIYGEIYWRIKNDIDVNTPIELSDADLKQGREYHRSHTHLLGPDHIPEIIHELKQEKGSSWTPKNTIAEYQSLFERLFKAGFKETTRKMPGVDEFFVSLEKKRQEGFPIHLILLSHATQLEVDLRVQEYGLKFEVARGIPWDYKKMGFGDAGSFKANYIAAYVRKSIANQSGKEAKKVFVAMGGDAVSDIKAAQMATEAGIPTVGFAATTGKSSKEELLKAGARVVVDSLEKVDKILESFSETGLETVILKQDILTIIEDVRKNHPLTADILKERLELRSPQDIDALKYLKEDAQWFKDHPSVSGTYEEHEKNIETFATNPKVSIVVLHYGMTPESTVRLLNTLARQTYENFEVVLVDNNSPDKFSDHFETELRPALPERIRDKIKLVRNRSNISFTGGNNQAAHIAMRGGSEFVFFLNNDSVLDPKALEKMITKFRSRPDVGALQSLLVALSPELEESMNEVGKTGNISEPLIKAEIKASDELRKGLSHDEGFLDPQDPDLFHRVPALQGMAMMLRANVLHLSGGFDSRLFMYKDEDDASYLLRRTGFKQAIIANTAVFHGRFDYIHKPRNQYFLWKNSFLLAEKFWQKSEQDPAWKVFDYYSLYRLLGPSLMKSKWGNNQITGSVFDRIREVIKRQKPNSIDLDLIFLNIFKGMYDGMMGSFEPTREDRNVDENGLIQKYSVLIGQMKTTKEILRFLIDEKDPYYSRLKIFALDKERPSLARISVMNGEERTELLNKLESFFDQWKAWVTSPGHNEKTILVIRQNLAQIIDAMVKENSVGPADKAMATGTLKQTKGYGTFSNGHWVRANKNDKEAVAIAILEIPPDSGIEMGLYVDDSFFGLLSAIDRKTNQIVYRKGKTVLSTKELDIRRDHMKTFEVIQEELRSKEEAKGRDIVASSSADNLYVNKPIVSLVDGKLLYAMKTDGTFYDVESRKCPILIMWKDKPPTIEENVTFKLKSGLGTTETDIYIEKEGKQPVTDRVRSATFVQLIMRNGAFVKPNESAASIDWYDDVKHLISTAYFDDKDFNGIRVGASGGLSFGIDQLLENKELLKQAVNHSVQLKLSLPIDEFRNGNIRDQEKLLANKLTEKLNALRYTEKTKEDESVVNRGDYKINLGSGEIEIFFKENNFPFHIIGTKEDGTIIDVAVDGEKQKYGPTIRSAYQLMKQLGAKNAGILDQGNTVRIAVKTDKGDEHLFKRVGERDLITRLGGNIKFSQQLYYTVKKKDLVKTSASPIQNNAQGVLDQAMTTGAPAGGEKNNDAIPSSEMKENVRLLKEFGLVEQDAVWLVRHVYNFVKKNKTAVDADPRLLVESMVDKKLLALPFTGYPQKEKLNPGMFQNFMVIQRDLINDIPMGIRIKIFSSKILSGEVEKNIRSFLSDFLTKGSTLSAQQRSFLEKLHFNQDLEPQGVKLSKIEDFSSGRIMTANQIVYRITLRNVDGNEIRFFLKTSAVREKMPPGVQYNETFFYKITRLLGLPSITAEFYPLKQKGIHGMTLMEEISGSDTQTFFDLFERRYRFKENVFPKKEQIIESLARWAAVGDFLGRSDRKVVQNVHHGFPANYMILSKNKNSVELLAVDHDFLLQKSSQMISGFLNGNAELDILTALSEFSTEAGRNKLFTQYRNTYLYQIRQIQKHLDQIKALIAETYGETSPQMQSWQENLQLMADPDALLNKQFSLVMAFYNNNRLREIPLPGGIDGLRSVPGKTTVKDVLELIRNIEKEHGWPSGTIVMAGGTVRRLLTGEETLREGADLDMFIGLSEDDPNKEVLGRKVLDALRQTLGGQNEVKNITEPQESWVWHGIHLDYLGVYDTKTLTVKYKANLFSTAVEPIAEMWVDSSGVIYAPDGGIEDLLINKIARLKKRQGAGDDWKLKLTPHGVLRTIGYKFEYGLKFDDETKEIVENIYKDRTRTPYYSWNWKWIDFAPKYRAMLASGMVNESLLNEMKTILTHKNQESNLREIEEIIKTGNIERARRFFEDIAPFNLDKETTRKIIFRAATFEQALQARRYLAAVGYEENIAKKIGIDLDALLMERMKREKWEKQDKKILLKAIGRELANVSTEFGNYTEENIQGFVDRVLGREKGYQAEIPEAFRKNQKLRDILVIGATLYLVREKELNPDKTAPVFAITVNNEDWKTIVSNRPKHQFIPGQNWPDSYKERIGLIDVWPKDKNFVKMDTEEHAEMNALSRAASNGWEMKNTDVYISLESCENCAFGIGYIFKPRRVVIATLDAFIGIQGKGNQITTDALGKERLNILEGELNKLAQDYNSDDYDASPQSLSLGDKFINPNFTDDDNIAPLINAIKREESFKEVIKDESLEKLNGAAWLNELLKKENLYDPRKIPLNSKMGLGLMNLIQKATANPKEYAKRKLNRRLLEYLFPDLCPLMKYNFAAKPEWESNFKDKNALLGKIYKIINTKAYPKVKTQRKLRTTVFYLLKNLGRLPKGMQILPVDANNTGATIEREGEAKYASFMDEMARERIKYPQGDNFKIIFLGTKENIKKRYAELEASGLLGHGNDLIGKVKCIVISNKPTLRNFKYIDYEILDKITGPDAAMSSSSENKSPGGIDLTGDKMNVQVQNEGEGIQFKFDPAMIEQLQNASGLTPVIIDIRPMTTTVPMFLGMAQNPPEKLSLR